MQTRIPNRTSALLKLKLVIGSAAAVVVMLSGVTFSGCSPNFLCLSRLEFYSMQLNITSGLTALLAVGFLLSALKDLLVGLQRIDLLERNVESIADLHWDVHG